jgi:hypothetical protein
MWRHSCLDSASILRSPHLATYKPDDDLKGKIARYLGRLYGVSWTRLLPLLPLHMPRWGKSRIKGGGDDICAAFALQKHGSVRDNSYVRVSSLDPGPSHCC